MSGFSEQTILITGASGGLGAAVVRAFLSTGATVVGVSMRWAAKAEPDPRLLALDADLSNFEGARQAVTAALEETGRVDALVHLVGGFSGGKPAAETSEDDWERMMSLNLRTACHTIRAALPHMLKARRGRILAIGSRTGLEPGAGTSAYNASKAALHALIRSVAAEVKDMGVTANAVVPSVIDTPANRAAMPKADPSLWVRPEAIASLLVWLASEEAGDVNGALIPIYGRA